MSFIAYIKKHYNDDPFDIVKCFKKSGYNDQKAAEEEFKSSVRKVATWSTNAHTWAQKQIRNDFSVRNEKVKNHIFNMRSIY